MCAYKIYIKEGPGHVISEESLYDCYHQSSFPWTPVPLCSWSLHENFSYCAERQPADVNRTPRERVFLGSEVPSVHGGAGQGQARSFQPPMGEEEDGDAESGQTSTVN